MDVQLGHVLEALSGFCIPTVLGQELGQEPGPGAIQQGGSGHVLGPITSLKPYQVLEIKPDTQTQPPIMYFQGSGS